jgi:L-fuculose-phosphate aldolase
MVEMDLKEQLASATRLFWEKGLTPGNDAGDVSIRDPKTGNIYICPMATADYKIRNWGVVTASDMVILSLDGKKLEGTDIKPTIEKLMHLYIYRARPEINAIVHSHAVWSSTFAVTGKNIPAILVESGFIGGEVVCAEYGKVGSKLLAENIVKALGDKKKAALLRNHGAVALGKNIEEAFTVSDYLEKQAKVALLGSTLGKLLTININDTKDESNI